MSARRQYTDCYVNKFTAEVSADAADGGTVDSAVFDTEGQKCFSPSINVRVKDLGNNKKIALKLQHSDQAAAGFVDVTNDADRAKQTDMVEANEISENTGDEGLKFYYVGEKRYIKVVVVSKDAAPDAKVDIWFQQHKLANKPGNEGF